MIIYFKELLFTLKEIEKHLKSIAACVRENHHGHGHSPSISTVGWND